MGSSFATLASDQDKKADEQHRAQAQKSRVFHSGASSANTPHDRFNRPLTKEEVRSGNVPHFLPPNQKKADKPTPVDKNPNPTHAPKVKCPVDAQKGWIITEGHQRYMLLEDGTKIDLDHPGHGDKAHDHHKPSEDVVHQETEDERNLKRNPLLTPEEEKLREEIEKHGIGSLYNRPDHSSPEFGKELHGKVYFKATSGVKGYKPGLWVEDPQATKVPPRNSGKKAAEPAKKDPVKPGAVGLTVRTNTAQTNPKTGQVELQQGAANVAQTGLTLKSAPQVDVKSGIPTPPPPPKKLGRNAASKAVQNVVEQAAADKGAAQPTDAIKPDASVAAGG
jgi:hypothetical protein